MTDHDVVDLGDLVIPFGAPEPVVAEAFDATVELLSIGAFPVLLGGEHSVSAGPIAAFAERYPDLAVVQFDAHADLRDSYLGSLNSHACAMRRALDHLEVPGPLLQVGIRSGTRSEWQEMRTHNRYVPGDPDALTAALPRLRERPIYLTIDLDVFDPASLPGTGTPEAGGLDWPTFVECLRRLPGDRIVGMDVMELAPTLDPTGRSSVLAAKVVRETVLHARG
jgi:agmatinase